MTTLNKSARDAMVRYRVHACTDVTGFGLLGHSCLLYTSPLGVLLAALGVQLIHLLGRGGDEHVAVGPLLDLGLQRAGGVVSGHHGDLRGHGLVGLSLIHI